MDAVAMSKHVKLPYSFRVPPPGWLDRFPDGDYTVGRGADPRGKASDDAVPAKDVKPSVPAPSRMRRRRAKLPKPTAAE
jgi:hypothetical protein